MRRPSVRRPGFTLIELLLVIAIIAILSMATFALFRAASNARNKARSKGDIQAIAMACENYKKTYGDYPCRGSGGNDDSFRKDMFDQLVGRRIIKSFPLATGTAIELLSYNDSRLPGGNNTNESPTGRKKKAFINYGDIRTNDDANFGSATWTSTYEFRDAWENPYDYRYRTLNPSTVTVMNPSTGVYVSPFADWKSPNFLVVSCGANFVEPSTAGGMPDVQEYWETTGTMRTNGIIPTSYFDDGSTSAGPFRADNVVNWTN